VKDSPQKTHIERLEQRLHTLRAQLPAHSISPSMMAELDELEDELALLRAKQDREEQSQ
jgi:hypothetical protein